LLELPNLLALLDWLPGRASPEQIVATAGSIEQLLANLGRPAAVRSAAAQQIGAWSKACFNSDGRTVERLLAAGDLPRAYQAAATLHQRALAAGEMAYPGADYDIAVAHFLLGRVLSMGGQAAPALPTLAAAQRRFQALADAGNADAASMITRVLEEQGMCLMGLGKLEEAAISFQTGADLAEKLKDYREAAVTRGNLGTVRMLQERYADALAAWEGARTIFEELDEPGSVATAWHQIGMVHKRARQFEAAERAYRQGLSIRVQHKLRSNEAGSLGELGNLYNAWGRPEQAVAFYRQAADIYTALGDQRYEGSHAVTSPTPYGTATSQ
jgi:tetratricopeptide (TPR) repeat protein